MNFTKLKCIVTSRCSTDSGFFTLYCFGVQRHESILRNLRKTRYRVPKLRLGLHDGEHYQEVIDNADLSNTDNNIAMNFNFFMKRLGTLSDSELSDLNRSTDRLDLAILSMDDGERYTRNF